MYFILSSQFACKLNCLRANYSEISKTDLSKKSNPNPMCCFFGAKDKEMRHQQISFLEKLLAALDDSLLIVTKPDAAVSIDNYFNALALMMAACCYVKSQIKNTYKILSGKSVLINLIDDALGISPQNVFDEETTNLTFLTAKRYLAEKSCFERLNNVLKNDAWKKDGFSESQAISALEWEDFSSFLDQKLVKIRATGRLKNYPCTQIIQPLFSKSFKMAGGMLGQLLSTGESESLKKFEVQVALKAVLGGAIILATKATPTKVAFMVLSPLCSELFLKKLIPLGFQTVGSILGGGVGFGVGMSLDLSWKLTAQISHLISTSLSAMRKDHSDSISQSEATNGFCLMTREFFIEGEPCSFNQISAFLEMVTIDLDSKDAFLNSFVKKCPEGLEDLQALLQNCSEQDGRAQLISRSSK